MVKRDKKNHCVFSIPLPRLGNRKHKTLDKNHIPSHIMRDPMHQISSKIVHIL